MSESEMRVLPPRRAGWIKGLLALSLALNLAVVGLIGGAVLGDGRRSAGNHDGVGAPALRSLGLGPFAIALSREDRQELRERIAVQGTPLQEDRRVIGRSLREIQVTLIAEPFDRETAAAAFAQSRNRVIRLQEAGHDALLDQIVSMTIEERAELADNLRRIIRRMGPQN